MTQKQLESQIKKAISTPLGRKLAEAQYSLISSGWSTYVEILPADKQWYYIVNGETGEILNDQTYTLEQALGSCIVSGIRYKVIEMAKSKTEEYSQLLRKLADYADCYNDENIPINLANLLAGLPSLITTTLGLYVVENNHIHAAEKYFSEQEQIQDKLKIEQNKQKYKDLLKRGLSSLSDIVTNATIKSVKKRLD